MKKNITNIKFLVVFLTSLLVVGGCEKKELKINRVIPPKMEGSDHLSRVINYNPNPLKEIISSTVAENFLWTNQFSVIYDKKYLYFNHERLIREQALKLQPYFNPQNFDVIAFSHEFDLTTALNVTGGSGGLGISSNMVTYVPGATSIYSDRQLMWLNNYFYPMSNYTLSPRTPASHIHVMYNNIKKAVTTDPILTDTEKFVVMAAIDNGYEFAKNYWIENKGQAIISDMEQVAGSTYGHACDVQWRVAWGSGVVGGVMGAVKGAYLGAAGGTFTIPGIGTATGALGGGVFGFATGFATGAVSKIATDLLLTCFRKPREPQNMQIYCQSLPDYLKEACPLEVIDRKVIVRLHP